MELPGHCSLAGVARGRRETEEVHGAAAARGCRPADAPPRGGAEEAGPSGRRRCAWPRGGSSRTSRDAQGHAVPRGREDARGCEVAVAASPRSAPTLREFSRALLCSLFPSLLSFPRSIKPALTRFRAQFPPSFVSPLGFPPARSISSPAQGWRPPHPPWRSEDALGRPGGRLASKADAIRILARRWGRLAPRGHLDA